MTGEARRWDTDVHGTGIGDGLALAAGPRRLLDALGDPGWRAEDPEVHLLPHLEHGARPWRVVEADLLAGGIYAVTLTRDDPPTRRAGLRAQIFAVIGRLAEENTSVVERVLEDAIEYDVLTGSCPGDTEWVPHGHLLRLRVPWSG